MLYCFAGLSRKFRFSNKWSTDIQSLKASAIIIVWNFNMHYEFPLHSEGNIIITTFNIYIYIYIYIYIHTNTYAYIFFSHSYHASCYYQSFIYSPTDALVGCLKNYTKIYINIYIKTAVFIYVYVYTHTYIHKYIYIYVHFSHSYRASWYYQSFIYSPTDALVSCLKNYTKIYIKTAVYIHIHTCM